MTTISEYRRARVDDVLAGIEREYPQRSPHRKPTARHHEASIVNKGGNFCLPEDK